MCQPVSYIQTHLLSYAYTIQNTTIYYYNSALEDSRIVVGKQSLPTLAAGLVHREGEQVVDVFTHHQQVVLPG